MEAVNAHLTKPERPGGLLACMRASLERLSTHDERHSRSYIESTGVPLCLHACLSGDCPDLARFFQLDAHENQSLLRRLVNISLWCGVPVFPYSLIASKMQLKCWQRSEITTHEILGSMISWRLHRYTCLHLHGRHIL